MIALLEPEDFHEAIKVLIRRGWCQGQPVGPDGSVCAARALNMAVGKRTKGRWAPGYEARKWLHLRVPVAEWNDAYSTTFDEVVRRFDAAAARMRAARHGR